MVLSDGGGLVNSAPRPLVGAEAIARYLVTLSVAVAVAAFAFEGDRIKRCWAVRNPEKLRPWTPYGKVMK